MVRLVALVVALGQVTVLQNGARKGTASTVDCQGDTSCTLQNGRWVLKSVTSDGGSPSGTYVKKPTDTTTGLTAVYIDAGTILTTTVKSPVAGQTLSLLGTQTGAANAIDVVIGSVNARSGGHNVSFQFGGNEAAYIDSSGDLELAGGSLITDKSGGTAGSVISGTVNAPFGSGMGLRGSRNDGDSSSEFTFNTRVSKTTGRLLEADNFGVVRWYLTPTGTVVSIADTASPAFLDSSGISGHVSVACSPIALQTGFAGCYTVIAGNQPAYYWGRHGDVTVSGTSPRHAGYLLEINNGNSGTTTDKVLMVTYQGGIVQFGGYSENQFAICQNNDGSPPDGGFISPDAGFAFDGTLMYASDKKIWCYCRTDLVDGGAPGTAGDGWRQMSNNLPCGP